MKYVLITAIAALAFASSSAFAGGLSDPIVATPVAYEAGLDLSDRNGGLTKQVTCSNVQAKNGSVGGFYIPTIGYFVMEAAAELATVDAYVIPAMYHPKDGGDVTAYLQGLGLTDFELVLNDQSDTRIVQESRLMQVETEKQGEPEFELITVDVIVKTNGGKEAWCR